MTMRFLHVAFITALLCGTGCGEENRDPSGPPATTELDVLRTEARPLTGAATDYDPLISLSSGARVVMLGESTHGTHEYFIERARISQRLITERGFRAIVIEGDWPAAYRVNEYIRGMGAAPNATSALAGFTEFPQWMWGNEEIRELVEWLRTYNMSRPPADRVGFYGMDVYSLYPSITRVLEYLAENAPVARERVGTLYACFDPFSPTNLAYGQAAVSGLSCETEAVSALREVRAYADSVTVSGAAAEELFSVVRNAESIVNAESYFRNAYSGRSSTWNLRDVAMVETINAVNEHLRDFGTGGGIIVWAHNSHTGDARQTNSGPVDEINVGQLLREQYGSTAVLVGSFSYSGTVMAATTSEQRGRVQTLRPAIGGAFESMFHQLAIGNALIILRGTSAGSVLSEEAWERAVGVTYAPETELASHYFKSRLGLAYDAAIFIDSTRAVTPLLPQLIGAAHVLNAIDR